MKFSELVGKTLDFYGVDGNCFKLDDYVYEAIEDESDGYRSYLGSVEVKDPVGLIFFGQPIARVEIKDYKESSSDGYKLVDGEHVWLRVGTDNTDDYYPYFVFNYSPKER